MHFIELYVGFCLRMEKKGAPQSYAILNSIEIIIDTTEIHIYAANLV